jgi:hypothetical protein
MEGVKFLVCGKIRFKKEFMGFLTETFYKIGVETCPKSVFENPIVSSIEHTAETCPNPVICEIFEEAYVDITDGGWSIDAAVSKMRKSLLESGFPEVKIATFVEKLLSLDGKRHKLN